MIIEVKKEDKTLKILKSRKSIIPLTNTESQEKPLFVKEDEISFKHANEGLNVQYTSILSFLKVPVRPLIGTRHTLDLIFSVF